MRERDKKNRHLDIFQNVIYKIINKKVIIGIKGIYLLRNAKNIAIKIYLIKVEIVGTSYPEKNLLRRTKGHSSQDVSHLEGNLHPNLS